MADINDFIDPQLIKSLDAINDRLINSAKIIDQQVVPAINKLAEAQTKLGKGTDESGEKRKKLTAAEKEALRISKQLETTEAKINGLRTEAGKKLTGQKVELQKLTAETKRNLTATNALTGSYLKINAELNKNISRYKGLSKEQRENSKVGGKLLQTIKQQDKALKGLDFQMGRSQRSVGKYSAAFKGLIGAFGVTGGILGFVSVLRNAGKTIAQFDQAQATTAATLGKTKDEIDDLTKSSIELGRVTQFTATEVSILQNELAKLGFTANEIQASTAGVLDFAAATGSGLGEAAQVAGQALRAFGLDAAEMDRVVSVLAVSTTKSALTFSDFASGLSNVAPVAKAFGFTIEDTVALFGKLRDAGFDASKATTATRNIILNLADANSALSKEMGGNIKNFDEFIPALIKLRESGIDLNTTLELTDKRSVAAFNQFLEGAESAKALRDSITNVNTELAELVETKTDNVIGASKRLASAWEGVLLKFREGSGVFKRVLDDMATSLNAFGNENISVWKKIDEITTLGLRAGASEQQKIQDNFAKNLRTASRDQIIATLKNNQEFFEKDKKFNKGLLQLAKNRLDELEATEKASTERIADEKLKSSNKTEPKLTEAQIKEAERRAKKTLDIEKKLQQDLADIKLKSSQDRIDIDQDFVNQADKDIEKEAEATEKAEQKKAEAERKRLEILSDFNKEQKNTTEEKEKEDEEKRIERNERTREAAFALGNSIFDFRLGKLNAELAAAEGNEQKQAEIRARIAKAEKQKALFNATINTARGITGALASVPPNIPLAIIVGAIGAIQALKISTTPIPSFAKGVTGFRGGVAELAERGPEMIKESSGKILLAENRGLYNLSHGSTVLTAPQTQRELNDRNIVKGLKGVERAVKRMPRQRTASRFDERQKGFREGYLSGKHRLN